MSKLNQLKSFIHSVIPEILEVKFGCEVLDKNEFLDWAKVKTFIVRNPKNGMEYYSENDGSLLSLRGGFKNFKILGRPITLADCLRAIDKEIPSSRDLYINGEGGFAWTSSGTDCHTYQAIWNLEKDSLDEQSDDLVNFLFNLLIK